MEKWKDMRPSMKKDPIKVQLALRFEGIKIKMKDTEGRENQHAGLTEPIQRGNLGFVF